MSRPLQVIPQSRELFHGFLLEIMDVVAVVQSNTLAQSYRSVVVCPGCRAWQVEWDSHIVTVGRSEPDPEWWPGLRAAEGHRRSCPGLDMLAGLLHIQAIPFWEYQEGPTPA